MDMLHALLVLWAGNTLKDSSEQHKTLLKLVQMPVIWDAMTAMWRNSNDTAGFTTGVLSYLISGIFRLETIACLLSGVPDYFDRNKILSGYDLSHYQVPHCIRVLFCLICVYSSQFSILF